MPKIAGAAPPRRYADLDVLVGYVVVPAYTPRWTARRCVASAHVGDEASRLIGELVYAHVGTMVEKDKIETTVGYFCEPCLQRHQGAWDAAGGG